jgi:hypothetical protein
VPISYLVRKDRGLEKHGSSEGDHSQRSCKQKLFTGNKSGDPVAVQENKPSYCKLTTVSSQKNKGVDSTDRKFLFL